MSRNKLSAGVYEKWMGKEEYKKQSSIADHETGDAVFGGFSEIIMR